METTSLSATAIDRAQVLGRSLHVRPLGWRCNVLAVPSVSILLLVPDLKPGEEPLLTLHADNMTAALHFLASDVISANFFQEAVDLV